MSFLFGEIWILMYLWWDPGLILFWGGKNLLKTTSAPTKKGEKERKYLKPGKIKLRNVTKSQSKINVSKRIQINSAVIRKLFGSIFMSILSKNYNLRYFFVGNCGRKSRCLKGRGEYPFSTKILTPDWTRKTLMRLSKYPSVLLHKQEFSQSFMWVESGVLKVHRLRIVLAPILNFVLFHC